jgi:Ca2+-binding RTX toxin-like protein
MASSFRTAGVALGAALLTSAVAASGASAAGATDIACANGVVSITAAPGTTNGITVTNAGAGKYTIRDIGNGASLSYTPGGCLTGISNYTTQQGTITVSGTISAVSISTGDLVDAVNTTTLVGKAAVYAGTGNDLVNTGSGNDTVNGQAGNDTINTNGGNDIVAGDVGVDTIKTGDGNDAIFANDGFADKIDGGAGTDSAYVDIEQSIINVETITF